MPKYWTSPTLINDLQTLKISDLKRLGYMNGSRTTGTLTWSTNGEPVASINIEMQTNDPPYLMVKYSINGEPMRYVIPLQWFPSNLRRGRVWYFLCTKSNKRCRHLVLYGGRFVHRSAVRNGMYLCQTYSHRTRQMITSFKAISDIDEIDAAIYGRYFKRTYRGKETRKYKRLMNKIKSCQNLTWQSLFN